MALLTTISTMNGIIVVHCRGEIVLGEELTSLRILVKELLSKSRQIVFDLRDVTHIDSRGLGTLVALHTSARNTRGDIRLANLGSHLSELLQVTRLVTVFQIFDNVEQAVASFNSAAAVT